MPSETFKVIVNAHTMKGLDYETMKALVSHHDAVGDAVNVWCERTGVHYFSNTDLED